MIHLQVKGCISVCLVTVPIHVLHLQYDFLSGKSSICKTDLCAFVRLDTGELLMIHGFSLHSCLSLHFLFHILF